MIFVTSDTHGEYTRFKTVLRKNTVGNLALTCQTVTRAGCLFHCPQEIETITAYSPIHIFLT